MGDRRSLGSVECAVVIVGSDFRQMPELLLTVFVVNHDDFMSRHRMTNLGRAEVLRNL